MNGCSRVIAVVDLFADAGEVIQAAMVTTRGGDASVVRFVTLFEHLDIPMARDGIDLSPEERFRWNEAELLRHLRHHAAWMGAGDAECTVLTGHPGEELAQLASQWGADLILAGRETARTLHNGWVPCFHAIVALPCPLVVVPGVRPPLLQRMARWLKGSAPKGSLPNRSTSR